MSLENVKTAGRTLDLFEVFAESRGPLSLTELAQAMDSPLSSTHALVRTLRARGYLYVLEDRKLIYPTKRILNIARWMTRQDPLIELAQAEMKRLLGETNETIILGKRQGEYITYLEVIESSQSIRYSAQPGDTKPLHSSAIGKATLSLLPDDEILELVGKLGAERITDATIVSPQILLDDIRAGRQQNVFVTRGENVPDVMGIALSLRLAGEEVGIAIAGPINRLSEKEAEYAALLKTTQRNLNEMEAPSATHLKAGHRNGRRAGGQK